MERRPLRGPRVRRVPRRHRELWRIVGISIIAAGGQSIVGKKRAAGELFCGLIQQVIHRGAILVEGEFIVNRGDTRGHTKIIFGEMDECMSFCIVESCGVKQGDVRCPFLGRQTLSQGVVVQVLPETFQRHCCIKLSPGFSSMAQFDLSHFSNHLRDVMVRNRPRPSKLRIGAERAHEGSPGEFTSCQRADYLALPHYLGARAEYLCDHQFRCGCRGPWRNLFEGDELSSTQKLT